MYIQNDAESKQQIRFALIQHWLAKWILNVFSKKMWDNNFPKLL